MTDRDNKKANVLVTFCFSDDSDYIDDVDTDFLVQKEIAKVMLKLVDENKIAHFTIGDDDVISEKLSR